MQQGDIVIINFPFTSFENSKVRPAIVISNSHFNNGKNILLLAVSTKEGLPLYSEKLESKDLKEGKLNKMSYIRFSNILSIEKRLILRKVAELKEAKVKAIYGKLDLFLKP